MMRNIIAIFCVAVLVGAGCFGGARDEHWLISFDLPDEWVMYGAGSNGYVGQPGADIQKTASEVVLQNTEDAIYLNEQAPSADADVEYRDVLVRTSGYTAVRAFRLDERRIIPRDAEDLGKGFYRVKECEEGESCTERNAHNYAYYFTKGEQKFKFVIYSDEDKVEDAVKVILSAKSVRIE